MHDEPTGFAELKEFAELAKSSPIHKVRSVAACAGKALDRAEAVGKNEPKTLEYIVKTDEVPGTITDADTHKMLFDDLAAIP